MQPTVPELDPIEHIKRPSFWFIWGMAFGFLISAILFNQDFQNGSIREFLNGLAPEAVGIIFTVIVLDRLNKYRNDQRDLQQLVREFKGKYGGTARQAVDELQKLGLLREGLFKGTKLQYINLQDAYLIGANFQGSDLYHANLESAVLDGVNFKEARLMLSNLEKARLIGTYLEETDLSFANLFMAHLFGSYLKNANLYRANLQNALLDRAYLVGAKLKNVNLQDAELRGTNLQGTDLSEANLAKVRNVKEAYFDEETTLPDGAKWTPETDMTRFTDPNHPNFWRSDDPSSPAYHGKMERDKS